MIDTAPAPFSTAALLEICAGIEVHVAAHAQVCRVCTPVERCQTGRWFDELLTDARSLLAGG